MSQGLASALEAVADPVRLRIVRHLAARGTASVAELSRVIGIHPNTARTHLAALEDADVVLLATEWAEYKALDPVAAGELVREKRVLDGRNALDAEAWRDAGWSYRALGRGVTA